MDLHAEGLTFSNAQSLQHPQRHLHCIVIDLIKLEDLAAHLLDMLVHFRLLVIVTRRALVEYQVAGICRDHLLLKLLCALVLP